MGQGVAQIVVFVAALTAVSYPLGLYMARVFEDDNLLRRGPLRFLGAVERGFYRAVGDRAATEQTWKQYGATLLVFSFVFVVLLYAIQRLQGHLFLNPEHFPSVASFISFNTAASFLTNTNWQ